MKSNSAIRQETLSKMKGNWGAAVLAFFVFFLISVAVSSPGSIYQVINLAPSYWLSGGSWIVTVFLLLPLEVGIFNAYKAFCVNGDTHITGNIFNFGFTNYWHNVGGQLLTKIFIILWTLLFIIPGIIMALAYFCVPYILVDNPELTAMEAIKKSKAMMKGHKMDLFLMILGYLGFILLCILTLGIALFWIAPYYYNVFAGFYENLKNQEQ